MGRDAGEVAGIGPIGVVVEHDCARTLSQAHVIIDFSVADAALAYIHLAAAHTKAIVVGTTGFTAAQHEEIRRLSQDMPCFIAPNMSVGVNVMLHVLRQMVTLLGPGYDIEILEAHHRTKADAPSGTALRMAAVMAEARGNHLDDIAVYGRRGMIGRRSDTEIGIQVVRAGEIVGEHRCSLEGQVSAWSLSTGPKAAIPLPAGRYGLRSGCYNNLGDYTVWRISCVWHKRDASHDFQDRKIHATHGDIL